MANIMFYNETDNPIKFGLLDGGNRTEFSSGVVAPHSKGPDSVGGSRPGDYVVSVWWDTGNGEWRICPATGNATTNGYVTDFHYDGTDSPMWTVITLMNSQGDANPKTRISIAKTTNPPI